MSKDVMGRNEDRDECADSRYDRETEEGIRRHLQREVCLCTDESTDWCPIHDPLFHDRRR